LRQAIANGIAIDVSFHRIDSTSSAEASCILFCIWFVFLIEKIAFGGVVIGGTENGEKGAVER
jgi:hypothetical protein